MARGDIPCPLDGQPMSLPVFSRPAQDTLVAQVGDHSHLVLSGNMLCPNGHRWVFEGGEAVVLRRIQ